MTIFQSRLSEIMKAKHITQKQLAKLSNSSEATISRYILGKSEPQISQVIEFSQILGVNPSFLFGETNNYATVEPFREILRTIIRNKSALSDDEKTIIIKNLYC